MAKVINTISATKSLLSFYFHMYSYLTLVTDFVSAFQNIKCVTNINVSSLLTRPFTREILYISRAYRIG